MCRVERVILPLVYGGPYETETDGLRDVRIHAGLLQLVHHSEGMDKSIIVLVSLYFLFFLSVCFASFLPSVHSFAQGRIHREGN
jgi:hypothetical protein